ncbi:MAG: butyrate kinase [Mogibacterium sp.]|nr:butyrate kinase [Mogibacterium sp.]
MGETILALNFGSTSSKIAIYEGPEKAFATTIRYDAELLASHKVPASQFDFRRESVLNTLKEAGYDLADLDAVISRAGPLKPMDSGTYLIDEDVMVDCFDPERGGLGTQGLSLRLAKEIADEYGIPAYLCDPVTTDELTDVARPTGLKGIERKSGFHALNQKRIARFTAKELGKTYEESRLIGVHLGGGVSVVAHLYGRCVDEFACLDEGAFAMDRPGSLPNRGLVDLCFSGLTKKEIMHMLTHEAGVTSYTGTSNFLEVEQRMDAGDQEAALVFHSFIYQIAKDIGAMAAVLSFNVDAVFLTGGIVFSKKLVEELRGYIGDLAPVYEFPGEDEMQALADNAVAALRGEITVKKY